LHTFPPVLDIQEHWAWVLKRFCAISLVSLPVCSLTFLSTVKDYSAFGTDLQFSFHYPLSLSTARTLAMSYVEVPWLSVIRVAFNCSLELNICWASEIRVENGQRVFG